MNGLGRGIARTSASHSPASASRPSVVEIVSSAVACDEVTTMSIPP